VRDRCKSICKLSYFLINQLIVHIRTSEFAHLSYVAAFLLYNKIMLIYT